MYRSFPSLVVGQIEEEDSSRVTRESEDIKCGGNWGIPTCVGAAGYQRGWESIAMCVNLPETMLWRCGEGGGSWWKCGKWSRVGAGRPRFFYIYLKTCTNKTFAQKIFLMIGAWQLLGAGKYIWRSYYWEEWNWKVVLFRRQFNDERSSWVKHVVQRWLCRCDLLWKWSFLVTCQFNVSTIRV